MGSCEPTMDLPVYLEKLHTTYMTCGGPETSSRCSNMLHYLQQSAADPRVTPGARFVRTPPGSRAPLGRMRADRFRAVGGRATIREPAVGCGRRSSTWARGCRSDELASFDIIQRREATLRIRSDRRTSAAVLYSEWIFPRSGSAVWARRAACALLPERYPWEPLNMPLTNIWGPPMMPAG